MVFIPTYLYIKRHSVTDKLYFGKTINNPEIYHGSGLYWKRHLKSHGKEYVETLWYCLFYDKESINEFALNFSKQECIVESEQWLNLKDENGLDGGSAIGRICSNNSKVKMQISKLANTNRVGTLHSDASKLKMRHARLGRGVLHSEITKTKISLAKSGKSQQTLICPHCNKSGGNSNMTRYHFDNCKSKS